MEHKLPLLIYDDQCPLCVRFKQGLERLDLNNSINYAPLSDSSVFQQYPQLDPEACRTKVHFLCADGVAVTGQEIVVEVVKTIPGVGKLAWLLETDVGRSASAYFMDHVENLRKKIHAKDKSCGTCES